jgi:hypothetical protein
VISTEQAGELLRDVFEEEALVIGGLTALHDLPDAVVCRLMDSLDVIRRKTMDRLARTDEPPVTTHRPPELKPHPAIEAFLRRLRSGQPP